MTVFAADRTESLAARSAAKIRHRTVEIERIRVFCRKTGPSDAPALLTMHGFPAPRTCSAT
jgi:hypothetical protein